VDLYEASVWSAITGGSEFGTSSANYPCGANGDDCTGTKAIFARSVAGVTPSAFITWFQAQQACANAGKRLLTNAEWQMAAAGTPDGSTTSCNTHNTVPGVATTGSFTGCVSNYGVQDMVGNVWEWVADWLPRFTACGSWSSSSDTQCIGGAATTGEPSALVRGGSFSSVFLFGSDAGVFAVNAGTTPSEAGYGYGFRCAR
jgi:formylglycine-generating enzyme required for sulfatase activity